MNQRKPIIITVDYSQALEPERKVIPTRLTSNEFEELLVTLSREKNNNQKQEARPQMMPRLFNERIVFVDNDGKKINENVFST